MALTSLAEVFSPPRFTKLPGAFVSQAAFSTDLGVIKENGESGDLTKKEDQEMLEHLQEREYTFLLAGSPPCEAFSAILNTISGKMDPEKVAEARAAGVRHLHVAVAAYSREMQRCRHFVHEHPWSANSWKEDVITKLG